jgi:hypothetical protein
MKGIFCHSIQVREKNRRMEGRFWRGMLKRTVRSILPWNERVKRKRRKKDERCCFSIDYDKRMKDQKQVFTSKCHHY